MREDYSNSERVLVNKDVEETIDLPKSNVLKYKLEGGAWFCIRPFDTEPKTKFFWC